MMNAGRLPNLRSVKLALLGALLRANPLSLWEVLVDGFPTAGITGHASR
jgi:hypothetical protein